MLALYNELEEIIPLFLFSEFVKGQHYLCLECLAELTLETTKWLPDGPVAKDLPASAGDRGPLLVWEESHVPQSNLACALHHWASAPEPALGNRRPTACSQRGARLLPNWREQWRPRAATQKWTNKYKNCTKCFPSRKIFTHWPVSLGIKGLFRLSILFSIWCFTHFKTHVHVNTGETLPQTTKFLSLPKLCAISVQHFSFPVVNPTNPDIPNMVLHSQYCLDLDSPTVFASQNLSWDHFPSP